MSPKSDVSHERIPQIIDAAIKVFSLKGFDQARMEDVGREAGISKATVYLYFKSKDSLIEAIMERVFSREVAALTALQDETEPAEQRLRLFGSIMMQDITQLRPVMPLMYDLYALGLRKKHMRRLLGDFLQQFVDMVAPVIQQGIERGEFQVVDARDTAVTLAAALEGVLLVWGYAPDLVDLERQMQSVLDLLLAGLKGHE
jgi:AcrR family transcriptional regulator